MDATVARGLPAWRDAARPLAGELAPLLDRVDHLLPASYRDVVVRTPYRIAALTTAERAPPSSSATPRTR